MNAPSALLQKFVPASELGARLSRRPLVFTNGVFDVLHCGHVIYLEAARSTLCSPDWLDCGIGCSSAETLLRCLLIAIVVASSSYRRAGP